MPADGSVREVVAVFLRLGTIAFGGPVAHTAIMSSSCWTLWRSAR